MNRAFTVARLALGSLLLASSACHKEAEELVTPGAIAATILPAGFVTQLTATAATGHLYTATPDATTDTVQLPHLPAGTYTVTVATKLAYKTPAP